MIEYAIVGIKTIIVTWIINPCYSYIITTSNKSVSIKVSSLTLELDVGFFNSVLAYLSSETKKERI